MWMCVSVCGGVALPHTRARTRRSSGSAIIINSLHDPPDDLSLLPHVSLLHIHFFCFSHWSLACLAMPTASSPLAPKGQLTMATKRTPALLLVFLLLSILLFTRSCEARGLRGHGKGRSSSSKSSHLPGKVGITDEEINGLSAGPIHSTDRPDLNKFHLYWLHILIRSRLSCAGRRGN